MNSTVTRSCAFFVAFVTVAFATAHASRRNACLDFPAPPAGEKILTRQDSTPPRRAQWGSWMDVLPAPAGQFAVALKHELDLNHEDGIGRLQLAAYIYLSDWLKLSTGFNLGSAVIEVEIRGQLFRANDAAMVFWIQKCVGGDTVSPTGFVCSNWALTSTPLTPHLQHGRWSKVRIALPSDPAKWTYAGNRNADGERRLRYRPLPLSDTLDQPINMHFALVVPAGGRPASGIVRFKNIRVCRR